MSDDITPNSLAGGNDVVPTDGQGAVPQDDPNNSSAVSLRELVKQATGKDFPSDEAALKSIKDTFSYVGKAGQVEKELERIKAGGDKSNSAEVEKLRQDFDESQFYSENPDLKSHKDIISTYAKAKALPLAEVVKLDEVKKVIAKVKGFEEIENSKSVLQSNPRLGTIRNKIQEGKTALGEGNYSKARENAVSAVVDILTE